MENLGCILVGTGLCFLVYGALPEILIDNEDKILKLLGFK